MMNNPFLLAGLTIILWSFGSLLSRLIAIKSEFVLLSLSFAFTFITILIYSLVKHGNKFIACLKTIRWKDIAIGPFGYFVYSAALNQSYREFNNASETTILNYTWPVFTVLFTYIVFKAGLQKDSQTRLINGLGIFLGFLSVVVLATHGQLNHSITPNLAGLGWGLLAGISYGFFSAYSGTVSRDRQSVFLLTAITISLGLMIVMSIQEIDILITLNHLDFLVIFALGCILNGIGYITWTRSNRVAREKGVNISSIASMMFVLPILSLFIIAIFLGETLLSQPYFILSLLLVFLSAVLCQRATEIANILKKADVPEYQSQRLVDVSYEMAEFLASARISPAKVLELIHSTAECFSIQPCYFRQSSNAAST